MRYLDTAFQHLAFAIKLMQAAEDGALRIETIDRPLAIREGGSVWPLPDHVLNSQEDLVRACQNFVGMSFGAAAITLNRCREEASVPLPDPIVTECEQWVALIYQIRNAFAHDIAEPRWEIRSPRYAREYAVGPVAADLRSIHGKVFDHADLGGSQALFRLKEYGEANAFGRAC